jgi:hypothetical protein
MPARAVSVTPGGPGLAARIEGVDVRQPIDDATCVLHRATPYDTARHQRLMQRTTVSGDPADPAVLATGAR